MTSIAANYTGKNLLPTNPTLTPPALAETTSKISNLPYELYLGPGYTNVPAVTNLYCVPYDAYYSLKASIEAYRIGDREGLIENGLRIASSPFNLSNAALQLTVYGIQLGIYLQMLTPSSASILTPLGHKIGIAGLVFSFIEGILETLGIVRSKSFLNDNYPFDLESLKKFINIPENQQKIATCLEQFLNAPLPEQLKENIKTWLAKKEFTLPQELLEQIKSNVYLNYLSKLQKKYFKITPEKERKITDYVQAHLSHLSSIEQQARKDQITHSTLEKKKTHLIRRVQHWLTRDLKQKIPGLVQDLQSSRPEKRQEAIDASEKVFSNLRIQSYKKILVNAVGLIAVITTIAGLILGLAACPYFIPLALLIVGGTLSFVRYGLHLGLLETQGWHFDGKRCIPGFLKASPEIKVLSPDQPFHVPPGMIRLGLKRFERQLPKRPKLNYTPRTFRR